MEPFCDLTDKEFVPFLNKLGVDTYKKSFEWMLSDPDFAGILQWLYNNLDQNNALSPEEELRYTKLEKTGSLLPPDELEASVTTMLMEYPGLPLPGDVEALEDLQMESEMMQERLKYLKKQEASLQTLIEQNELSKDQLNSEVTKLSSAERQCRGEEAAAGAACAAAAAGAARAAGGAVGALAGALAECRDTATDKEISSKFFAFGPFESYRQSQALFRSHFALFAARWLGGGAGREEAGAGAGDARGTEERLSEAVQLYAERRAALAGEQAKLELAGSYEVRHNIVSCMEEKSAIKLLSQEELILEEQLRHAAAALRARRGALRARAAAARAHAQRSQALRALRRLHGSAAQAHALDAALGGALRREARGLRGLLQLAGELRDHLLAERDAVSSRMESMKALCSEQDAATERLTTNNYLLSTLSSVLSVPIREGALATLQGELEAELWEARRGVGEVARGREAAVGDIKRNSQPIRERVFSGCAHQPSRCDRGAAALSRSLTTRVSEIEDRVRDAGAAFTRVKGNDAASRRKLWQWFLTEPSRLRFEA